MNITPIQISCLGSTALPTLFSFQPDNLPLCGKDEGRKKKKFSSVLLFFPLSVRKCMNSVSLTLSIVANWHSKVSILVCFAVCCRLEFSF